MDLKFSEDIFYRIIFFGYLAFLGTTLKLTLNLASISSILTATLVTLPFLLLIFKSRNIALSSQDLFVSLLSCALILSCFINMFTQGISYIAVVQTLGFIFPWLIMLCVVFSKEYISRNQSTFWEWFNKFIVFLIFLGLLEYLACFYFGFLPPFQETPNGYFFVGYTTVFHAITPELPHYRFYGPFGEPGDLAMWGSILVIYNLFRRNYVSVVIIFLALFLSASPSVYISLLLVYVLYAFKSRGVIPFFTLFLIILALWYFFIDITNFIDNVLINKQTSLEVRSERFFGFFDRFMSLVLSNPFGIPFFATTYEARASGLSFSGNFTPILAFDRGGITALTAYLIFLVFGSMVSFLRIIMSKNSLLSNEIYVYFLILLPFVVQRQAALEFGLFPILFSAIFLGSLRSNKFVNV